MLENSTAAFFTLTLTNPIQKPYDYEFVRPIIAVCRYLLTGIMRRAGRETQAPTSAQCRTPAWYHKDTEEVRRLKAAISSPAGSPARKRAAEGDGSEGAPAPPSGSVVYSAKLKQWTFTGK